MKVALVYDRINKWGGAERVLLALQEIWPEAPIYTAVYNSQGASWAKTFNIKPSFLNRLPLASAHHELYPWLTPFAFESFNFDEYEVVISVTSAEAKNIITKPKTLHICYCLTPTRYLWSGFEQYKSDTSMGELSAIARSTLDVLAPTLRRWDLIAASRPDYFLAISNHVKKRIEKYYGKKVEKVIYPPVDIDRFTINGKRTIAKQDYFLVVSRLVGYKRIDIIIDAFNKLGWPLIIIGDGLARKDLGKKAGKNIKFITGYLTEEELVGYYRNCEALVIAADEDFGLTAVEALASGRPVICYRNSGVAESVTDGKTGILFLQQSAEALIKALYKFKTLGFSSRDCWESAGKFSKDRFMKDMIETVNKIYGVYNNYLTR